LAHNCSRETSASPEAVWNIWSKPDAWPEWNPDVQEIKLNGPLAAGTTGTMRTKRGGAHPIRFESVESGKSFQLQAAAIPGAKFHFRCTIEPLASGGSRISQSISMSGGMAWLYGPMIGSKIAQSFEPILAALAQKAEANS
jgi:Polyketide cyclase / dehydrase and lipid transport